MATTFDPAPYDFGDVSTGLSDSASITITNDGNASVSITFSGSGFSMSPSSVTVAAADSVTVTIVFSPSSATSYSATITSSDGDSCSISGDGIDSSTTTGGDITTTTGTHMLFKVPDFSDGTFEQGDGASDATLTTMTSYLRLGSFDYDDESDKAKWLLDLIPQVTASTDPSVSDSTVTLATLGTTGTVFVDDIRTRAQDSGTYSDEIVPDYGSYTTALTVSDDPGHKLTMAQRQQESARIYSRGGWRDHSDGNRITTTYGDKVEVIRGNYKMIVMGRQDETGEAMGWEASGSHCQDFSPGTMPGASFFLEWINDARYYAPKFDSAGTLTTGTSRKGVWLLVNTTENVYEYARYAGNFREERWGDVIETYIGSENPPDAGAFATDSSTGNEGHSIDESAHISGRNYDLPTDGSSSTNRATPSWDNDNSGKIRSNPHIIEKTWAERIDSYEGTSNQRIPVIQEERWVVDYNEVTNASGNVNTSFTARNFTEIIEADSEVTSTFKANTFVETFSAESIEEIRSANSITTRTKRKGGSATGEMRSSFGFADIQEYFYGNFFEIFIGASESVKVGAFVDVTLGAWELNVDVCVMTHLDVQMAPITVDVTVAKFIVESALAPFKVEFGSPQEVKVGPWGIVGRSVLGIFTLLPCLSAN